MTRPWRRVRLGEVLEPSGQRVEILPTKTYEQITVRLWGKGLVSRGQLSGAQLAGDSRLVARAGQFIISKIDARNGAYGIVPPELDGAVATNDFPLFDIDGSRLNPDFLRWYSRTRDFVSDCARASKGSTNRVRLSVERFLGIEIPLPDRVEQDRIVARLDAVAAKVDEARRLRAELAADARRVLESAFQRAIEGAPYRPMAEVAPLVRREVQVEPGGVYPELGIRSFGKGTFHKPSLGYMEVGTKRLFRIERGDLLFSNVFAWEGAIAVAGPEDHGRVGSHRFMTCVPAAKSATSGFLQFYFTTDEGLAKVRAASPGGAGRNRTLGVSKLAAIDVPVPALAVQVAFDALRAQLATAAPLMAEEQPDELRLQAVMLQGVLGPTEG
jgi:type I restriction enzyme S subunit